MSALFDWFKQIFSGSEAARRAGGFRAAPSHQTDDILVPPDENEIFASESARLEARHLRKEELASALRAERGCRESFASIKAALKKHNSDRNAIVEEEERTRRLLRRLNDRGGDAEKRRQIQKILDQDLPQALTVIDMNINKCEMNIRKIEQDMSRLEHERKQIVASYLKTFLPGEDPDLDELPTDLVFDYVPSNDDDDRLEGEDELWGDNSSDLEINDSDVEEEILDIGHSESDDDDDDDESSLSRKAAPLMAESRERPSPALRQRKKVDDEGAGIFTEKEFSRLQKSESQPSVRADEERETERKSLVTLV